jgi:hypothetical protein
VVFKLHHRLTQFTRYQAIYPSSTTAISSTLSDPLVEENQESIEISPAQQHTQKSKSKKELPKGQLKLTNMFRMIYMLFVCFYELFEIKNKTSNHYLVHSMTCIGSIYLKPTILVF